MSCLATGCSTEENSPSVYLCIKYLTLASFSFENIRTSRLKPELLFNQLKRSELKQSNTKANGSLTKRLQLGRSTEVLTHRHYQRLYCWYCGRGYKSGFEVQGYECCAYAGEYYGEKDDDGGEDGGEGVGWLMEHKESVIIGAAPGVKEEE
jgi:hypothetical protein